MSKGCWKLDENEEAVFIDIDDEEDKKSRETSEEREYSQWSELPNLLLEKIFSYLSIREKYYASLVCRSWNYAFYLPYVWSRFVLEDTTLTRSRFNYYSGWQSVLDHFRTQLCLSSVGRNFRHLTVEPMFNFYNLYEFINMISWYVEQSQRINFEMRGVGCKIETLKFTFPCDMVSGEEQEQLTERVTEQVRLFGTGGKLLEALKRLMRNLKKMKRLELYDLMLEPREAQHLLDEVCESCCLTLKTLILVNTTRVQCSLLHVGVFLNLQVLIITPQNINETVIELLSYTNLKHLHIIQNRYTPTSIKAVSWRSWKDCKKENPKLRVHLQLEGTKENEILWQQNAPVQTVLYDSNQMKLQAESLLTTIEYYKFYLKIYGQKGIPKYHSPKSFTSRVDNQIVMLCQQCPLLHTLIIREPISTATLLLVAKTAKNLKYFHVRYDAVIVECDWSRDPEWTDDLYDWLKINSRSYVLVEKQISQILRYNWKMLSDREFENIPVDLHADY